MKEIRSLALCSTRFAGPAMHRLLQAGMLAAVAVPAGNDEAAEYAAAVLRGANIPVISVSKKNFEKELLQVIAEHHINLGLVLTFSWKITVPVFSAPVLGFYNFHPGPLPLYRGADPIFQQIKRGEPVAGITLHLLDEGIDTGPIVMQEKIKLLPNDTYGLLTTKLAFTAMKMLDVLLRMLSMDIVPPQKKQDAGISTFYKKQGAADVIIRWNEMAAGEIVALMHACNPWNKGAVTQINNMILRLPLGRKMPAVAGSQHLPGTIISIVDNEMVISALNGEGVSVAFVHMEEGILNAGRLGEFNITAGSRFEEIK